MRSHVALVLELLLQERIIHPRYFYCLAEVVLGKLGDPDSDIKNAFVRLLAIVVPTTLYACGLHDYGTSTSSRAVALRVGNSSNLQRKQGFALKQVPQQLHSQQLVTIIYPKGGRCLFPLGSNGLFIVVGVQKTFQFNLRKQEIWVPLVCGWT
ncbi:unnamed protein product [Prunus armeniaca]